MMFGIMVVTTPFTLVTVNVAEVVPGVTVTVPGTVAAPTMLLARLTTTPVPGAGMSNVTVPVDVEAVPLGSLITLVGFKVTDIICGGFTVKAAVCAPPLNAAEIIATVWAATVTVDTVNVAVVAPPLTVTLSGTLAAAELLPKAMTAPPVGAGPLSVTVAIEVELAEPPSTEDGVSVTMLTAAGTTVRVAF